MTHDAVERGYGLATRGLKAPPLGRGTDIPLAVVLLTASVDMAK